MKDLKNKNCLITGAANGLGKAFALGLAQEGMNLFITKFDSKLGEISKSLMKEMHSKAILPHRAVNKYIKGIKNNQLYIYDSKAVLSVLTLKGTNQPQFEEFLKNINKNNEEKTRKHFLKYGIDIDKYK